ncbi:YbaB/EbfC family nucleoid-associated protein [bacterium]|nr:YbaB/EbfC family nucleoid-associated protein [bacterium]MCK4436803.1 YbaB/EbfC family nucleoid-associated protein [bacterium]
MKGLWQLLNQAKTIQGKMAKVQQELREKTVEAGAGGGMVAVKVNGEGQILSIKIEPEVVDSKDMEMLEDLVLAAVNEGLRKAQQLMAEEMGKITGGINIPGLSQMLGSGT